MKRKKKSGGGWRRGGQGRCERRSDAFVEIQKKNCGGGGGRSRVGSGGGGEGWGSQGGCEQRSEAFVKIKNKIGGCRVWGVGFGRGVRVDVNGEVKFS